MPDSEKEWIRDSEPLMRHIRSGSGQFISDFGMLAVRLVKNYHELSVKEGWGPLSGQRVKQIENWLKPDIVVSEVK